MAERQLRGWERQGLLKPAASYDFHDLIALRTLAKLRADRLSTTKIRRAVEALRAHLGENTDPLTEVKLFADGSRIHVQIGGQTMEPVSGQLLLDFDEEELRRLVAFPGDSEAGQKVRARERQRQADRCFQRGVELEQSSAPVEEVIQAYSQATELDPQMAAAWVNLGTIWFSAKDWKEAERCYRKSLEASPSYALAHFNLGNLYDERGDRAKALFHYQAALRLEAHYADAHYNLALLYQGASQFMKALRHWKIYLKLDPASQWADIARREVQKIYEATVVQGRRGL